MFSESKLGTSPFMKISGSTSVAKRILKMKLNNWCIVLSSVSVWQSCTFGTVECVYLLWLWAHKGSKLASWTRCCSNHLPDVIFWILQGNIFFSVAAQLVQWDKSLRSHHLPVTFSVVILPGLVCKNSRIFTSFHRKRLRLLTHYGSELFSTKGMWSGTPMPWCQKQSLPWRVNADGL